MIILHSRTCFSKGFAVPIVFPCFSTQLLVSRHFHLTIYRVVHEESESELKNYQILEPYAVFVGKTDLVKIISPDYFLNGFGAPRVFIFFDSTGGFQTFPSDHI